MLAGTTFNLSWMPPSIAAHLTTGYNLTCLPLLAGVPAPETLELLPTATTAAVTGLFHGVTYNCSITTVSDAGASEPQTVILTTAESSKYFHKLCCPRFLFFHNNYILTSTLSHSTDVCSRSWRETSCLLLVSSTSDPAKWSHHKLHTLLLSLSLFSPSVSLPVRTTHCDWLLSGHCLLLFNSSH